MPGKRDKIVKNESLKQQKSNLPRVEKNALFIVRMKLIPCNSMMLFHVRRKLVFLFGSLIGRELFPVYHRGQVYAEFIQ